MGSIDSSGAQVVTINVAEAKVLIESGYAFLDVRTVEEFKEGYVATDKIFNIPYMFNSPQGRVKNTHFLEEVLSTCSKEEKLVVGCRSGVRSLYAAEDLIKAGYNNVSNMGRGYLAWVENGFPVVKPEDEVSKPKTAEDEL